MRVLRRLARACWRSEPSIGAGLVISRIPDPHRTPTPLIALMGTTSTVNCVFLTQTTQRYAHLSQDTLFDAANVVPFTMDLPMVSMVSASPVEIGLSR